MQGSSTCTRQLVVKVIVACLEYEPTAFFRVTVAGACLCSSLLYADIAQAGGCSIMVKENLET